MVKHTPLRRSPKLYEDFYCAQGGQGFPVFVGGRSQRGHGLGSFFGGLGRMILPWLKTGGKALLREGVGTGLQVAQEALAGRNFGESFKEHAKEAGGRLLQGASRHLNQSGSGVKRRQRAPPGEPARKRIKPTPRRRRSHKKIKQSKKQSKKHSKKQFTDIFT